MLFRNIPNFPECSKKIMKVTVFMDSILKLLTLRRPMQSTLKFSVLSNLSQALRQARLTIKKSLSCQRDCAD